MTSLNDDQLAVWHAVLEMNRQWTKTPNRAALERFFHSRMIAACAGEADFRCGQLACVNGWMDFAAQVQDLQFTEHSPIVELHQRGTVAIVAYTYDCSFKTGGQTKLLTGRDLLTLLKDQEQWTLIADHFS